MQKITDWTLYLDESGDFEQPNESVCIAGVMLREAPSGEADRILIEALRRVDPIAPYPPHATELRQPAWWLAAWMLADPKTRSGHPLSAALIAAFERIRDADAPELAPMLDSLARTQMPPYAALVSASRWLRSHVPAFVRACEALDRAVGARYLQLTESLARQYGAEGCFILAACDPGDAHETASDDRYLTLLTVLFERVFALLRSRPPARHTVRVVAASRRVQTAALGRFVLRAQDVGACVRVAERFPLDPPLGPTDTAVRIIPAMPVRYDTQTPPGVVLADFIANRLRPVLSSTASWATVRHRANTATGLSLQATPRVLSAAGPKPTLAAAGAPRRRIAWAFEHREGPPTTGAGWQNEQADQWVALALNPSMAVKP